MKYIYEWKCNWCGAVLRTKNSAVPSRGTGECKRPWYPNTGEVFYHEWEGEEIEVYEEND